MINKINREYPVFSIKYQIILECIQLFSLKKHFPKVSVSKIVGMTDKWAKTLKYGLKQNFS